MKLNIVPLLFSLLTMTWFFTLSEVASATDLEETVKSEIVNKEINALVEAIERSQCQFHRNGSTYSALEAADHLRLKLRRGAKYAKTAESFIDNLASKSSWSGKPYFIECSSTGKQKMNTWFHQKLLELRS